MRARPAFTLPGFTLLEMLVVLLVLALAATAVPRLWGAGRAGLARAAAEEAAAALREARSEARRSGAATRVVFDTVLARIRAPGRPARQLPAGAVLAAEGVPEPGGEPGQVAIRFDAEGGSSGGRVRVALGSAVAGVEVDWVTGHARLLP
jgi:general secretion pathway protein H